MILKRVVLKKKFRARKKYAILIQEVEGGSDNSFGRKWREKVTINA